jgi:outer membrane protein assembly factor BamA
LHFAIAQEKRLSDEDVRDKKEGTYFTGTPDFSSDPVNGFGYGGEGSIYFNGKRSDPFFNYTAYRLKIDIVAFNTTKDQREFFVKLDVPYIFNTKWRLRVEGGYEANPNLLFFGLTPQETLQGLTYYPGNDSSQAPVKNAKWSDYEKNGLVGENEFYNNYFKKEGVINVSVERSFFGDKVGALIGFELAQLNYTTFQGNSLLQNQSDQGLVKGVKNNFITIAQFGLGYDTRDLEPDPSSGVFLELTDEISSKSLGSSYDFNKIYGHANFYQSILPSIFPKLIFAGRLGLGYITGDAPFFEFQDQWSQEGDIEGLGGAHTLRGYKISRFVGRLMDFNNFELRWRFAKAKILNQQLAFSGVPFYDVGGVYDDLSKFSFSQMRHSEGLGLRIAWNVNTILRFDYAWSQEDRQFFFNLAHTF